jgi:hypothetical protein
MTRVVTALCLLWAPLPCLAALEIKTVATATAGLEAHPGYFKYYWDQANGKIWLQIDRFDQEFLYVTYLSHGLGAHDVGLDRGQIAGEQVVYFRRIGPKVLLMEKNYAQRAVSEDAPAERAGRESFPTSVLWGFEVSAEDSARVLVDATLFLLRDARNVVGALRAAGQGAFKLEDSRSAFDLAGCGSFPLNTEFESILTFTADSPGEEVARVAPTPTAVTLQMHHSLVQLPEKGFEPRPWDVRCGFFSYNYADYATPLSQPLVKRFIARHRLQKKNPAAALSEPVKPIVYYVDPAAPGPIRQALVDGARWWSAAFEAAGFRNAFRVEIMPDSASFLDLRYNTIQWVHRSSRGWSYGTTVSDPRTGEILKGHVTLGSLRARQDYLIAEGLLQPYESESDPLIDSANPMQELALARMRQLSSHEVGHTLGLVHNYVASTLSRASVMDYAYPLVQLAKDGSVDLSQAYGVGLGAWDKAAIVYGYSQFPKGADEDSALASVLDSIYATGLNFLSDEDARPEASAHPRAHLWDNGTDAAAELLRLIELRQVLLDNFTENGIPEGVPLVMLEETLVPIYMFHRYQIEACAKVLGGLEYSLAVRGTGPQTTSPVASADQWRALETLLQCVRPENLALPDTIVALLPPQTTDLPREREIFKRRTGDTFDPLTAAEHVADLVARMILNPARCARLVEQYGRLGMEPSLESVIDALLKASWKAPRQDGFAADLQRTVDHAVLDRLMRLAANTGASPQVRAVAALKLDELNQWIASELDRTKDPAQSAHLFRGSALLTRFAEHPNEFEFYETSEAPAGAPVGAGWPFGCDYE